MTSPKDKRRADFEAYAKLKGLNIDRAPCQRGVSDKYWSVQTQQNWDGWQAACEQQSAQSQQDAVHLEHVAVAEDGGQLRWMSGRKPRDCELYAMPDGSAIRGPIYRISAIAAQGASNV